MADLSSLNIVDKSYRVVVFILVVSCADVSKSCAVDTSGLFGRHVNDVAACVGGAISSLAAACYGITGYEAILISSAVVCRSRTVAVTRWISPKSSGTGVCLQVKSKLWSPG